MNLTNAQTQVKEWMVAFGQEVPEKAIIPSDKILELRAKLVFEEPLETVNALGYDIYIIDGAYEPDGSALRIDNLELDKRHYSKFNFIESLDGLGDSLFVILGTFVALGVSSEQVFNEIVRSNWTKFWTKQELTTITNEKWTIDTTLLVAERCFLVKNELGKVIKSPSFTPPNLERFLPKESLDIDSERDYIPEL